MIGEKRIEGAAQIPYLRRDIENYKKIIEMNQKRLVKFSDPEYLKLCFSQEERKEAIEKIKNSIEGDKWLIEIMQRQLDRLLREYPNENA